MTVAQIAAGLPVVTFEAPLYQDTDSISDFTDWHIENGQATVVDSDGFDSSQSLKLHQGVSENVLVSRVLTIPEDETVAFIDFRIKPAAVPVIEATSTIVVNGTHLSFVKDEESGMGMLYVLDGNDDRVGPEEWLDASRRIVLSGDDGHESLDWLRITIRQDYGKKEWDLYVDGELYAAGMGFYQRGVTLDQIDFYGSQLADVYIDNLQSDEANMLFVDADKDGVPDDHEANHGMDVTVNDRLVLTAEGETNLEAYLDSIWPNYDFDADGLSNGQEEALATNHQSLDTDGDGMSDGDEVFVGSDPNNPAPGHWQPVVWSSVQNATASYPGPDWLGSDLVKTAGSSWTSGAIGKGVLEGDGEVSFRVSARVHLMVGLDAANNGYSYTDIDYAIYAKAGKVRVYEKGESKGVFGNYEAGDTLAVERVGTEIHYKRNGQSLYTSATPSTGLLHVDSSIAHTGNAVIRALQRGFIADSDDDGMPDYWETSNGLDPQSNTDADQDLDTDGFTNLQDYRNATDPSNPDTDGDGIKDGEDPNPRLSAGIVENLSTGESGTQLFDTGTFNIDNKGHSLADGSGGNGVTPYWHRVEFSHPFTEPPVVTISVPTYRGGHAVVPVIRKVDTSGFEVAIAEWEYLDGAHTSEVLSYFAILPGEYNFGGLRLLAVPQGDESHTSGLSTDKTIPLTAFQNDIPGIYTGSQAPVVLTQAYRQDGDDSRADASFVAHARITKSPDRISTTAKIEFQEKLSSVGDYGNSRILWGINAIAIQEGFGNLYGVPFNAGHHAASINQTWKDLTLHDYLDPATLESKPFSYGEAGLFAAMQAYVGSDTAALRQRKGSNSNFAIMVQEEQSLNSETGHGFEPIAYLTLPTPPLIRTQQEAKLAWGEALVDAQAGSVETIFIPFPEGYTYASPVIVVGSPSDNDPDPATARVTAIGENGFHVALSEWPYQDGNHAQESFFWMVMEEGLFSIGGKIFRAGKSIAAVTQERPITFGSGFPSDPVVIAAQHAPITDPAASIRLKNISTAGFTSIGNYQEKDSITAAGTEVPYHYIAAEPGLFTVNDQQAEIGITADEVTHEQYAINFANLQLENPVFLAQMQTHDGGDTSSMRYDSLSAASVNVRIDEESSSDSERNHISEKVGYFAFSRAPTDTDGDGIPDDWELANGLDPNDPSDAEGDLDGDGLTNLQEYQGGLNPNNPWDAFGDPDGDGFTNLQEYQNGTDPNNADTNGDGIPDGQTLSPDDDPDYDSFSVAIELSNYQTNPVSLDTDHDGLPDWLEVDTPELNPLDATDASNHLNGNPLNVFDEYFLGEESANTSSEELFIFK